MTTPNTETARARRAPSAEMPARFTLDALVDSLASLGGPPSFEQLNELLSSVQPDAAQLRPYVSFKEATYARHRVFMNEFVELLVLCWRPGQRTPIHDHNGSFGVVRVYEGVMWETMFDMDDARGLTYRTSREWMSGQLTGADVPDIHLLGNPDVSGQDLITLHAYAPPLTSLNVYKVGRKESVSTLCMNSWNPTI